MGGIMSVTGHEGAPPTRVGTSIGDITAGLFTAIGINAALYHRTQTGEGTMIDVAMLDCQVAILENAIARYFASGTAPGPLGARHPSITPFAAYATSDGNVIIAAGNDKLFADLAAAIGRPDLLDDPRFASNDERCQHVDALAEQLEKTLRTKPTADWLAILDQAGIPCGPINNVEQALNDEQVRARNMVVTAEDATAGSISMAGNPIKMSAFADPPTRGSVPALDGDRDAILKALGDG